MAIYTRISPEDAIRMLARYDLGRLSAMAPLDGGQANSSFEVATDKGVFILSVCDEKSVAEIDGLTRILSYLESKKYPTSRLVRTRDSGSAYLIHDAKPVYVKRFVPGQVIQALSPAQIRQVGEALAWLHFLDPPEGMSTTFPYGMEAIDELLSGGPAHPYLEWLSVEKRFLEQALNPDMGCGFIHGDLFWDNLVFSGDRLAAVLDFEEACFYYRLFDLGMAAVGCCARGGKLEMELVRNLVRGYREKMPLTGQELLQLKVFIEYAAVATSLWRFRQYNIRRPDPEKADSYREMTGLADQVHAMKENVFRRLP